MGDADLQLVEDLFQEAADLDPEARGTFLEERCQGRDELRERVVALLSRLDSNDSLTVPIVDRGADGIITEGPGSIIGRYKLLQVIGEGGFGVVYMAEQTTPIVRKVALKIIKLGMDTREVVARFEAERQALAMMDHPNIAKVLDGGATSSGRPYFVMELVRGVAITDYCDKNELTTIERLELFIQVCNALQHAHQKGVIHRDLKPSNVLVTLNDGQAMPKVIDFGVAKAMHTRLTEKTLFTKYEQFIGTPAYMSPEQAEMSALDVDTRTDIYSLGVLLYELLTGGTPFDTANLVRHGLAEVQRVIREEPPQRPSLRISTIGSAAIAASRQADVRTLARRIKGDLDWIVLKAIEKERSRRYVTANELAEDIRRHLRNEPVLAGPPSTVYRLRKLFARNRTAVVSAALILIVLIGGIIGTSLALVEADRQSSVAKSEAGHAFETLEFVLSTLSLANPEVALDPNVTVRSLLDHTAVRVADAFVGRPRDEARVRSTIGQAYAALSEHELAETQLRRAIELIDESADVGESGMDGSEFYRTLWALTNVCFNLDRPDAFAVSHRARKAGHDHIGESYPQVAADLNAFLRAMEAGAWSREDNALGGVDALFHTAVDSCERTIPERDPLWPIVADTFLVAGYLVWYTPHEPLALDFWATALKIQQRELDSDHPDRSVTVNLLVGVLINHGRSTEAEELVLESLDALKRVHREDAFPIAAAEGSLGEVYISQERYSEAEPYLLRSHEQIMATVSDETRFLAVESVIRLITLYDRWDRPDESAQYKDQLARACQKSNYVVQWSIAREAIGPNGADLKRVMDEIDEKCGGVFYHSTPGTRQADELLPLIEQYVQIRPTLFDDEAPLTVALSRLQLSLANGLVAEDHVQERRLIAQHALPILRGHEQELAADVGEALNILAQSALFDGDHATARRLAREAWSVVRGGARSGMWFTTNANVRLARTLAMLELYDEAEVLLRTGYEALASQLGEAHHDTSATRALLQEVLIALGRTDEAAELGPPEPLPPGV